MSNYNNEALLLRAHELADELASDPAGRDDRLYQLIKDNDLDNLRAFVSKVEGELSQEHFHSFDLIGDNDVY
jgi:hypothetical protein